MVLELQRENQYVSGIERQELGTTLQRCENKRWNMHPAIFQAKSSIEAIDGDLMSLPENKRHHFLERVDRYMLPNEGLALGAGFLAMDLSFPHRPG